MAANETRQHRTEVRFVTNLYTGARPTKGGERATHLRVERVATTYPLTKAGNRQYQQALAERTEVGTFALHEVASLVAELTGTLAYLASGGD